MAENKDLLLLKIDRFPEEETASGLVGELEPLLRSDCAGMDASNVTLFFMAVALFPLAAPRPCLDGHHALRTSALIAPLLR